MINQRAQSTENAKSCVTDGKRREAMRARVLVAWSAAPTQSEQARRFLAGPFPEHVARSIVGRRSIHE